MTPIQSPQRRSIVLLYGFLLILLAVVVAADDDGTIRQEAIQLCGPAKSCQECLETAVCDWYNPGTCSHSSMVIMDIARYSLQDNTSGNSVEEICQQAALDNADANLCLDQTDCASCTTTLLSDGVTTCRWFPEFEMCSADVCTMMGCGETSCDATTEVPIVVATEDESTTNTEVPIVAIEDNNNKDETTNGEKDETINGEITTASTSTTTTTKSSDCSSKTTCEECAATGDGSEASPFCAWVPVFFYEHYPCTSMSCDTVADPNCYSREKDDRPASEICAAANNYYEQEENIDSEASESNASAASSLHSMTSVVFAVLLVVVLTAGSTTTATTTSTTTTTTTSDCTSKTTCEDCAATGDGSEANPFCVWVPVAMDEHSPCTSMPCDTVSLNCYSRENDNRPVREICADPNPNEQKDLDNSESNPSASNMLQSMTSLGFAVGLWIVSMV